MHVYVYVCVEREIYKGGGICRGVERRWCGSGVGCMRVHACAYVSVCVHIHINVCVYPRINVCVYPRINVSVYPRINVCVYPRINVCVYPRW